MNVHTRIPDPARLWIRTAAPGNSTPQDEDYARVEPSEVQNLSTEIGRNPTPPAYPFGTTQTHPTPTTPYLINVYYCVNHMKGHI